MEQQELFSDEDFELYQPILFDLDKMPSVDTYKGEPIVEILKEKPDNEQDLPLID